MRKLFLILTPLIAIVISLFAGSYNLGIKEVVVNLFSNHDSMEQALIYQVRLPRILGAVLVGSGLAVCGACFQAIFKNPLCSPYTLGVSNGAGFGAALGIILNLNSALIQILAIAFGILAIFLTFLLTPKRSSITLILSGMLISALFASLISLLKFTADPFEKLPEIVFWIMGSLLGSDYEKILRILPAFSVCMIVLFAYRWKINILSLGDIEAKSFGINVYLDKCIIIFCCSVITASCVSLCGIVGYIGIVIPHLARIFIKGDLKNLLASSASFGISYTLLIDNICRSFSSYEIPLGVITGIISVPLFIYFIFTKKVSWQ